MLSSSDQKTCISSECKHSVLSVIQLSYSIPFPLSDKSLKKIITIHNRTVVLLPNFELRCPPTRINQELTGTIEKSGSKANLCLLALLLCKNAL